MNRRERLEKLRSLMEREGIDYFVIPTSDPHMSEYVLDRYKSRVYMTGFTGSAGYAVVTQNEALLWADGRYHVQAEKQIEGSDFKLMKWGLEGVDFYDEWLKKNVKPGQTVGFNGEITPYGMYKRLVEKLGDRINFKFEKDLIGEFWEDRPALPSGKAFILDEEYTGENPTKKLASIREKMEEKGATHLFFATLDDIAYTLNIRGGDDLYTPIVVSYLLIDSHNATLFVDESKIDVSVKGYLQKNGVKIAPYEAVNDALVALDKTDACYISSDKINALQYKLISENTKVIDEMLPTTMMKAIKNDTEVENERLAHIIDGAAVSRYLYWIKENAGKIDLNEFSAEEKLHEIRAEHESFISESFKTISAYKSNAAMAHYSASSENNSEIKAEGLYLVDSGGQYLEGTTDITRTVTLGSPTAEEIRDYTLTLKGHIDLFLTKFLKGTCGCHLDVMARGAMWKEGIDFKHGTGHGVGYCLGVHEGPMSISRAIINVPLQPGMVISNEPGIYRDGKHGIRIENLVTVTEYKTTQFGQFFGFMNLTLCPYERELIDVSILSDEELEYINEYHKTVFENIQSHMKTEEEKAWLKKATAEIKR